MKKIFRFLIIILILLLIIIVIKTIAFKSLQIETEATSLPVFGNESVDHLSEAIKFPTISNSTTHPSIQLLLKDFINFFQRHTL